MWNLTVNTAVSTIAYIEKDSAANSAALPLISASISSTFSSSSIWTTVWGSVIDNVLIVTLIGWVGSTTSPLCQNVISTALTLVTLASIASLTKSKTSSSSIAVTTISVHSGNAPNESTAVTINPLVDISLQLFSDCSEENDFP